MICLFSFILFEVCTCSLFSCLGFLIVFILLFPPTKSKSSLFFLVVFSFTICFLSCLFSCFGFEVVSDSFCFVSNSFLNSFVCGSVSSISFLVGTFSTLSWPNTYCFSLPMFWKNLIIFVKNFSFFFGFILFWIWWIERTTFRDTSFAEVLGPYFF